MKSNIFILVSIIIFITISAFSCQKWVDNMLEKKYEPDCTSGNCVKVNIKGRVYVKPSGSGLNKIPVDVFFVKQSGAWFPDTRKVVSGKTNNNGEFDFRVTIDTTSFEDYSLMVSIPEQKNYMRSPNNINEVTVFRSFKKEALQNIKVEYYKKTILTINLNRTQTDYFDSFWLYYSFENITHIAGESLSFQSALDKTRQFDVPANILINIWWEKIIGDERNVYRDSLICFPNRNNVFNINY